MEIEAGGGTLEQAPAGGKFAGAEDAGLDDEIVEVGAAVFYQAIEFRVPMEAGRKAAGLGDDLLVTLVAGPLEVQGLKLLEEGVAIANGGVVDMEFLLDAGGAFAERGESIEGGLDGAGIAPEVGGEGLALEDGSGGGGLPADETAGGEVEPDTAIGHADFQSSDAVAVGLSPDEAEAFQLAMSGGFAGGRGGHDSAYGRSRRLRVVHDDIQPLRGEAEMCRNAPGELAIDLDGDVVVGAGDAEFPGVEVVEVIEVGVQAGDDAGEVADEIEVALALCDDDVEETVVEAGIFEDLERGAVVAPIPDEDEGTFAGDAICLDEQAWRLLRGDLRGIEDVAERAEAFLELGSRGLDDAGIEADAGELDEVLVVRHGEIDGASVAGLDDVPRLLEVAGDADLGGEDIHGADGEDAEGGFAAGETIYHLIYGAIAPGGHDDSIASLGGFVGDAASIARAAGGLYASRREGTDAVPGEAGAFAAGGGIDDDDNVVHGWSSPLEVGGNPRFSVAEEPPSFRGVKRLSKVILISSCTVLGLAALALGGLWSYVHSDGARGKVEEAIGKALKVPVKFGKMSVELPGHVKVEGISTVDKGGVGVPSITATALHATFALRPLLSRNIELSDVVLDQPVFDWPQNAEGKWVWPGKEKKVEVKVATEPKAPKPAVEPEKKTTVIVRGVKLKEGTITLRDEKQMPVFTATAVMADFDEVSGEQLLGQLSAAKLVWNSTYVFEEFRTAVRYAHDSLELTKLAGTLFGGSVHGEYQMNTSAEGQPFKTHIELSKVDLNAVAVASGWKDGEVTGWVTGQASLTGQTDRLARLEGPGSVSVEGGHFKKLEFLDAIASFLNLQELVNLHPKVTTAEFKLRDEKAFVDSLVIATDNLRIESKGVAKFDGKLALDSRLILTPKYAENLPEIARGGLVKQDDGSYGLDFKVSGKTDKPKTDLAEKLMGGKVQDKVSELLGSFFGTKPEKKPDDKDKKPKKEKGGEKSETDKAEPTPIPTENKTTETKL